MRTPESLANRETLVIYDHEHIFEAGKNKNMLPEYAYILFSIRKSRADAP